MYDIFWICLKLLCPQASTTFPTKMFHDFQALWWGLELRQNPIFAVQE